MTYRHPRPVTQVAVVILLGFAMLGFRLPEAGAQAPPQTVPLPELSLPKPTIHTAPKDDRVIVQLETWLWIDDDIWLDFTAEHDVPGPTPTAQPPSEGSPPPTIRVSLRATPDRVVWAMGDGNTKTCGGPGNAYNEDVAYNSQSPSCSYRYQRSSDRESDDTYDVTATVYWALTATVDGVPQYVGETKTSSDTDLRVGEISSLNLGVPYEEIVDAINSQVQSGDFKLDEIYISPDGEGGVSIGETPDPPSNDGGGILGAITRIPGAIAKCFDGWGATCTKWTGVALVVVGTAALCAVTVGVGCAAAAIVVGSAAQGAFFCKGDSLLRCTAEGAAWGAASLVGAGVVVRAGRFAAPFIARAAGPLVARFGPAAGRLIPAGLRTAGRGVRTFGRRASGWVRTRVSGPITGAATRARARVWRTVGGLTDRLTGRLGMAMQRSVRSLRIRFDPGVRPYSRAKYGRTPTRADRTHFGAGPDEVVDHDPPLVQRFYEGDPRIGEKPGIFMTDEELQRVGSDRTRMGLQPRPESNQQGWRMKEYSREMRKRFFGK